MDLAWPFTAKTVTYIVGSPKSIAIFTKSKTTSKKFVEELRGLGDVKIKKTVKFIAEDGMSDEYIYIVDCDGIQLIVQMQYEDDEVPFDFSKYDA